MGVLCFFLLWDILSFPWVGENWHFYDTHTIIDNWFIGVLCVQLGWKGKVNPVVGVTEMPNKSMFSKSLPTFNGTTGKMSPIGEKNDKAPPIKVNIEWVGAHSLKCSIFPPQIVSLKLHYSLWWTVKYFMLYLRSDYYVTGINIETIYL